MIHKYNKYVWPINNSGALLHIGGDWIIEDLYLNILLTFIHGEQLALSYFNCLLERKHQTQVLIWREAGFKGNSAVMESVKAEQREAGGKMIILTEFNPEAGSSCCVLLIDTYLVIYINMYINMYIMYIYVHLCFSLF